MGWGDEMKKFGHQKVDQASFIKCSQFNVQHETGKMKTHSLHFSFGAHYEGGTDSIKYEHILLYASFFSSAYCDEIMMDSSSVKHKQQIHHLSVPKLQP